MCPNCLYCIVAVSGNSTSQVRIFLSKELLWICEKTVWGVVLQWFRKPTIPLAVFDFCVSLPPQWAVWVALQRVLCGMVSLLFHQEWAVTNAPTPRASILLACLELGSVSNVRTAFWCWTRPQVPSGRWPATNATWSCISLRMPTKSECRRRPATCAMQLLWT